MYNEIIQQRADGIVQKFGAEAGPRTRDVPHTNTHFIF